MYLLFCIAEFVLQPLHLDICHHSFIDKVFRNLLPPFRIQTNVEMSLALGCSWSLAGRSLRILQANTSYNISNESYDIGLHNCRFNFFNLEDCTRENLTTMSTYFYRNIAILLTHLTWSVAKMNAFTAKCLISK